MSYLYCCARPAKADVYIIQPQKGFIECVFYWADECSHCGSSIALIARKSPDNTISIVRKSNLKARKLFEKVKPYILYKLDKHSHSAQSGSKNYLYYSHFGLKKKCCSTLSSLFIGLQDPYEGLSQVKSTYLFNNIPKTLINS